MKNIITKGKVIFTAPTIGCIDSLVSIFKLQYDDEYVIYTGNPKRYVATSTNNYELELSFSMECLEIGFTTNVRCVANLIAYYCKENHITIPNDLIKNKWSITYCYTECDIKEQSLFTNKITLTHRIDKKFNDLEVEVDTDCFKNHQYTLANILKYDFFDTLYESLLALLPFNYETIDNIKSKYLLCKELADSVDNNMEEIQKVTMFKFKDLIQRDNNAFEYFYKAKLYISNTEENYAEFIGVMVEDGQDPISIFHYLTQQELIRRRFKRHQEILELHPELKEKFKPSKRSVSF